MGYLVYASRKYSFDDRVLAHLERAIIMKLRQHESFLLTWNASEGDGRASLWITPHMVLSFLFDGSREPAIDESWVALLVSLAHTPRGMMVLAEKEVQQYLRNHPEFAETSSGPLTATIPVL